MSSECSYDDGAAEEGIVSHGNQHQLLISLRLGNKVSGGELTQYDIATSKAYIPARINLACIGSFVLIIKIFVHMTCV